jgi:hypothetical protein
VFILINPSPSNVKAELNTALKRILPHYAIHLTKSLAVTLVYAVIPERCSRGHISIYAIIDG